MVQKDQEQQLIGRYSATGFYDKRFISQVLEEIRKGMPHQLVCKQYNIKPRTLSRWIELDGLGVTSNGLNKPATIQFKRSVVRAVESGSLSIKEAQRTYGIGCPQTIKNWIEQLKLENDELALVNDSEMKKKNPAKGSSTDNNQDIKALQQALEDAQLKIAALNTLIDVAEEQLKINIRKKPGAKQSND
jgi:transposase